MTESKICTCPSGDGSLVHPCPAHPAVEQVGGDERAAFELFVRKHCGMPAHIAVNWDAKFTNDAWEGWKARAALAQPSIMPPDRGPWHAVKWDGGRRVDLSSDDFEHDVALTVSGDFVEGDKFRYAQELAAWMNAHLAQPSPARAEQAEAERPEVVGYCNPGHIERLKQMEITGFLVHEEESASISERLMTVAQHERIVGALRAEIAEWQEAAGRGRSDVVAYIAERAKLLEGRDAALARVAELEAKLSDPTAVHQWQFSNAWFDGSEEVVLKAGKEGSPIRTLYTAPPAQAQQLHDLDKQCRDDVARALGLRPSQERGFAWSYLLASIKSCVKASEDAAQAQHSVPEGWMLVPVEPLLNMMSDKDHDTRSRLSANCFPYSPPRPARRRCDARRSVNTGGLPFSHAYAP
ncbi:hypothetical protein [Pseudomonas aeruginosa]|uniref:hypothetical protein n=1 Tax=Pseudomonas aeruginosa TaxID=287 RepID=UPI0018DFFD56|nr:hypothetical protein [Pseudomonas aeruginosa]QPZ58002.1 hypothetical protein I9X26_24225 [Pseudomonas aeruginosa]